MAESKTGPDRDAHKDQVDPLLACLVYLSAHYGRPKSARAIIAGLPYDAEGMKPQILCEAAANIGLEAKIVRRASLSQIHSAVLPCLLFLDTNQACVLLSRSGTGKKAKAKIYVPESETVKEIDLESLAESYNGYAVYIHPVVEIEARSASLTETKAPEKHWFWDLVFENRQLYMLCIVASMFINMFALVSPLYMMNVYDRVIPNGAIETGWFLGVGAITAYVFDFIFKMSRSYLIDFAGRRIDVIAARRLYDQLLNMRIAARPRSSGSFANMLRDFDSVREFFTSATITALVDVPFMVIFLFFIYQLGGAVMFVIIGLTAIVVVIGYLIQLKLKSMVRRAAKSAEAKHGLLVETITGLETIKAIGADGRFRARYGEFVGENARHAHHSRFYSTLGVTIAGFSQQIASIIMLLIGMYLVKDHVLSMGGLIASVILATRSIGPVGQVANLLVRYHQASGALATLERIMAAPVERPADRQFLSRPKLQGRITFKDVGFVYPGGGTKALEHVSFDIQPGEKVGIIGRVGSGKSTITRLLMGLYEPDDGTILLDGTDQRQIDPADYRRNMAYVAQDVTLFTGSVRENITAGVLHATDEEVLRAAQLSGVHDFVAAHPMGYDAQVGEGGSFLSGGQRQAVALARAIVASPSVLVCDEPTNAMDMQAEEKFSAYIRTECTHKTVIIVTHKNQLLSLVDRLILIDKGLVIADGPRDKVIEALNSGKLQVRAG